MKKLHTFTLIFLAAAFVQSAHAQIVANGSFETGTVGANAPYGNQTIGIDSTTIPSWRVYNIASNLAVPGTTTTYVLEFNVREDYANDGFGSQLVRIDVRNLDSAPVGTYGFDQTNYVPVTAGTTYTIGFYSATVSGDGLLYLNIAGYTGPGGNIISTFSNAGSNNNDGDLVAFNISNTATTVATATQPVTTYDGPYGNLQYYSTTFTPLAGTNSINLDFVPGAGEIVSDDDAVVLDQITVKAVPETSTWAMMLTGLATLVGFTVRRRGQSVS
jgi:hypothetical protein